MSYEPSLDNLPDDPNELDYKTARLIGRALREGWIDWGLENTRKKLGGKLEKWVEGTGDTAEGVTDDEANILTRVGNLLDRIENTQLRKLELKDKMERLDEGKPTENIGVQRIVMDKPPEGWTNPLDD